jgi:hypothetical protein
MKLVYLESPYAAATPEGIAANVRYALACMRDCLRRGEAPFASHVMYTSALRDAVAEERRLSMEAGFAWAEQAERTVVYQDRGISGGMKLGIERAEYSGREVEFRYLPGYIDEDYR